MRNAYFAAALTLAAAMMATPASAQIGSRATIDAGASFEDAPAPPLELKIEAPLSFGRVTIPNGVNPNAICRYDLLNDRNNGVTRGVSEIVDGAVSTAPRGGCAMLTSVSGGLVRIVCVEQTRVSYRITYVSAGEKGATFSQAGTNFPATHFRSRTHVSRASEDLRNSGTFTCLQDDTVKYGMIEFGGRLEVSNAPSLPRKTNLVVGSIQIEVNY